MFTIGKILIILTLIVPMTVVSFLTALSNFGVSAVTDYIPNISGISLQNSNKYNKIFNGIWFLLTFIASIIAIFSIFNMQ